MDDRIIELETRVAFQEDSINRLDQALHDQQQLIESLQRSLTELRERLSAISPSPLHSDAEEPPPPHY